MWLVLGHNVFRQRYDLSQGCCSKLQCTSECHPKVHVLKDLVPSLVQLEQGRNPKRRDLIGRSLLVIGKTLSKERSCFLFPFFTLCYHVIPK